MRLPLQTPDHSSRTCLHVLCVIPRGLDGKGGIDRLFRYLAAEPRYVDADSIKVRFYTSRGDSPGIGWLILYPFRVLQYVGCLLFSPVDIVHINLSTRASAYRKRILMAIARIMGKTTIVHFHGGGFEHMLQSRSLSVRTVLNVLRSADHCILLGDFWRNLLTDTAGLRPETTYVIRNAVPDVAVTAEAVRAGSNELRLIFAGEMHHRKGLDVLLESLAALDKRYPGWTCVIAGNGPIAPYRQTAERLGIAAKISFVGWLSPEDIHQLMSASDVIVLPSRRENLPLCLIEAAALSMALVATDEGATREILFDGVNGTIVPLSADGIADALFDIAGHQDKLASMKSASRAIYLERFTIDCIIRDLHAVYKKAGLAIQRRPSQAANAYDRLLNTDQ